MVAEKVLVPRMNGAEPTVIGRLGRLVSASCLWVAACLLIALPMVVATDFGGVLWWTQYAAALTILLATLLAAMSFSFLEGNGVSRRDWIVLPLIIWTLWAWLQTVALPPWLVSVLSPASHAAYTDWLAPLMDQSQRPSSFPISVSAFDTRHAIALLALQLGVVWTSMVTFRSPPRILLLFYATALGVAAHAAFGIVRTVYPDVAVWGVVLDGHSFGSFVNFRNAALLLNIGLAASLGLVAHRMMVLNGQEFDDPTLEFNEVVSMIGDRQSLIGLICATLCLLGLLVCGSRGGIVAAMFGTLLATGWLRQRRGLMTVAVVGAAIAVSALILRAPVELGYPATVPNQSAISAESLPPVAETRFGHWHDGWQTAISHFPSGSGLATYKYAYLPFQETGQRSWYHHAENLWLELLAEQGVIGVLVVLVIVLMIIRSLRQLADAPAPIDHGVRIMGWYVCGAILISQTFDFGLVLPGNLLIATILLSVVHSRAHENLVAPRRSRWDLWLSRAGHRWIAVAMAAIAVVSTGLASVRLYRDARLESVYRTAAARLVSASGDPDQLDHWTERLQAEVDLHPWPAGIDLWCEFRYLQVRLAEASRSHPSTMQQATAAYNATGPLQRRLAWVNSVKGRDDSGQNPSPVQPADQPYLSILAGAEQSLVALPLGLHSRKWQVYLDFAHRDPLRSQTAISQLSQLNQRNPSILLQLAAFAGDSDNFSVAASLLRTALRLAPQRTGDALELTERWTEVSPQEILHDDAITWRTAAPFLLRTEPADSALLLKCQRSLACEECPTKSERSSCESVAGDIAFRRGDLEQAIEHYQAAVEFAPSDADLRIKLIQCLNQRGDRKLARSQAQIGRNVMPEDRRFDSIIQRMANEDRGTDQLADPTDSDRQPL